MNRLLLCVFLFLGSGLLFLGCPGKKPACNRFNPAEPCYEKPALTNNNAPADNAIITTDTLKVSWEGNNERSEYNWRIDGGAWSGWSDTATGFSRFLDDGTHKLEIVTRYQEGLEADSLLTVRNFIVNALDTPAVFLYPRLTKSASNKVILELKDKGLTSANALRIQLSGATIDSAISGAPDTINLVIFTPGTKEVYLGCTKSGARFGSNATLAKLYLSLPVNASDTTSVTLDSSHVFLNTTTAETPIPLKKMRGSIIVK